LNLIGTGKESSSRQTKLREAKFLKLEKCRRILRILLPEARILIWVLILILTRARWRELRLKSLTSIRLTIKIREKVLHLPKITKNLTPKVCQDRKTLKTST